MLHKEVSMRLKIIKMTGIACTVYFMIPLKVEITVRVKEMSIV